MLIAISRKFKVNNSIISVEGKEEVEILDTDDCTVEKYKAEEIVNFPFQIRSFHISNQMLGRGQITEPSIYALWGRQLYIDYNKVYFCRRLLFNIRQDNEDICFFYRGKARIRVYLDYNMELSMSSIFYVDAVGKYKRIWFNCSVSSAHHRGHMVLVLGVFTESEFIGFERAFCPERSEYVTKFDIDDKYRLTKELQAKFSLLGVK